MQTAVLDNVDVRHRRMVWSKFVPAWDAANIVMPLKTKNAHVTPNEMRREQNNLFNHCTAASPSIHFQSTKQKQSHTWKKKMTTYTCAAYSAHLKIHRADGCAENCTTDKDLRSYIKMQDDLHSPKYFKEAEDHSRMQPQDRPVLWRAIEHCRKTGAIFVAVSLTNFDSAPQYWAILRLHTAVIFCLAEILWRVQIILHFNVAAQIFVGGTIISTPVFAVDL